MSHLSLIATFPTLLAQGRLQRCLDTEYQIELETRSLARLRQKPADFLNSYDRLFRHYSLLALSQHYRISKDQPHQTFRLMSQHFAAIDAVIAVIETRHRLKHPHGLTWDADTGAVHTLCQLLQVFDQEDAQACQSYLL